MKLYFLLIALSASGLCMGQSELSNRTGIPSGQITNGHVNVSFYIPDSENGFYRGTRFDWSGIIYSLSYKDEEYYGSWYTRIDPAIHNNVQRVLTDGKGEVVTGIASSGVGPAEEFLTNDKALGFDDAKPGDTFLKIGVGVLRRPDEKPYDRYRDYEIVDGGKWSTNKQDELLCIPTDHSYIAEVEVFIEGDATGGLILFYNNKAHSGILADKENIIANLHRWQFTTEKNVIKNHTYLRLKKVENVVDMYYSTDGKSWIKIENSFEISALHHNVLGGFLSLRLGLCSVGNGVVKFDNFTYKAIK